jgi:hypothetical protein
MLKIFQEIERKLYFFKFSLFWTIASRSPNMKQRFGWLYRLLLRSRKSSVQVARLRIMKIEVICFPETLVHIRTTRRYIPENGHIFIYRRESLKSFIKIIQCAQNGGWFFVATTNVDGAHNVNALAKLQILRCSSWKGRKVAGSSPDEVIEFFVIYFILLATSWLWRWQGL